MHTSVVGLFVHGDRSSRPTDDRPTPMLAMPAVDAVEGLGLREDRRYFRPADPGKDRLRQVSLIDEGTIWRHESYFGSIDRAFIKAQIILEGEVLLSSLLGATLVFPSGAELALTLHRQPCYAMDFIARGLRQEMQGGQQGALARVTKCGRIAVGDGVTIHVAEAAVADTAFE